MARDEKLIGDNWDRQKEALEKTYEIVFPRKVEKEYVELASMIRKYYDNVEMIRQYSEWSFDEQMATQRFDIGDKLEQLEELKSAIQECLDNNKFHEMVHLANQAEQLKNNIFWLIEGKKNSERGAMESENLILQLKKETHTLIQDVSSQLLKIKALNIHEDKRLNGIKVDDSRTGDYLLENGLSPVFMTDGLRQLSSIIELKKAGSLYLENVGLDIVHEYTKKHEFISRSRRASLAIEILLSPGLDSYRVYFDSRQAILNREMLAKGITSGKIDLIKLQRAREEMNTLDNNIEGLSRRFTTFISTSNDTISDVKTYSFS